MKKRILHIQLLPLLSGVQNVMLHLLQGLDPDEFEIYVACQPGGPLVEAVKIRGYHYLPLPLLKHKISPLDAVILGQLFFLCRKYRFDIVHTHSSKPGLLGRIAARLAGVPLVMHTGHGAPFHSVMPEVEQRFYLELERLGALFCHKMVFVNNYHREFYLQHKLISADKALTIYNALEPELQTEIEQLCKPKRSRKKIITIGSLLRFSAAKNIVMTVNAAIKVCQQRSDVQFIFVGDGELLELCRMMVRTNQLEDRILLPGWQNDTAVQLSGFDAFLHYSNYEGLPVSIIEAMYAGLPIIGSDISPIAELVDETSGWLIKPGQLDLLVAELHKIIDARDCYKEKGEAGRKKIRELCSYENFLSGYLSLYRNGQE
ncbi:MAG: glycosyltransferase [Candidatus Cloacimonadaceae bacterium]